MSDPAQVFTILVEGLDTEPPKLPVHIVVGDADRASDLCDSLKVRFRTLAFSLEHWSDPASPPAAVIMVEDARKGVFGEEAASVCNQAYRMWEFMEACRTGQPPSEPPKEPAEQPNPPPAEPGFIWLNATEAAVHMGVTPRTVRTWIIEHTIGIHGESGTKYKFSLDELNAKKAVAEKKRAKTSNSSQ